MNKVVSYVLVLFLLTSSVSAKSYYSPSGFKLEIPETMVGVNQNNYKQHIDSLPASIIEKFNAGSTREIIIDKDKTRPAFFVVDISPHNIYKADIDATCEKYKQLDGDSLRECGLLPGYGRRYGFWALTYGGHNKQSFVRIYFEYKNEHLFVAAADRYSSEYLFRKEAAALLKIIRTIR